MIVAMVKDTGDVIVQSHLTICSVDHLFVPPAERRRQEIAPSAAAIPKREVKVKDDRFGYHHIPWFQLPTGADGRKALAYNQAFSSALSHEF